MTLSYIALFAWTFVVLFPLYWLAVTALKTPLEVNGGPFYIPWRDFQPTLDSWHYIFFDLREDPVSPAKCSARCPCSVILYATSRRNSAFNGSMVRKTSPTGAR